MARRFCDGARHISPQHATGYCLNHVAPKYPSRRRNIQSTPNNQPPQPLTPQGPHSRLQNPTKKYPVAGYYVLATYIQLLCKVEKVMAVRRELKDPKKLLKVNYSVLSLIDLKKYLTLICLAEYQSCGPKSLKALKPYRLRLRAQRIKAASHYQKGGGVVSPLIFKSHLPVGRHWPGIAGLIQQKGFEELIRNA